MRYRTRVFHGPNPSAPCPCVLISVDRSAFEAQVSAAGAAALAGHCARAYSYDASYTPVAEGGDTLARARFLAEWARETLEYRRGWLRHSGADVTNDAVHLSVGFHEPELARSAMHLGLKIAMERTAESAPKRIDQALERLWTQTQRHHADFEAENVLAAAEAMGLPAYDYLAGAKLWQVGQGARSSVFFEALSDADPAIAANIARRKPVGKVVMARHGLPVPAGRVIGRKEDLAQAAAEVGFPCAVKPVDAGRGRGVSAPVRTPEELASAFDRAAAASEGPILLERFVAGTEYRLIVLHGRLVTAMRRVPSCVRGDGERTVRALVDALNAGRPPGPKKARYHAALPVDAAMEAVLAEQGVSLDTVLPEGREVAVNRPQPGVSGSARVRDDGRVHPKLRAMVEDMSRSLGLAAVGFDAILEDVSADPDTQDCAFLELNTCPSLAMMVGAGWETAELGPVLFRPGLGRIPTRLVVSEALPDEAPADDPGHAVAAGPVLRRHGREMRPPEKPWGAVMAAVQTGTVERLTIHATPAEIMEQGFPLDRIDDLVLDAPLPADWRAVAQRIAGRLSGAFTEA